MKWLKRLFLILLALGALLALAFAARAPLLRGAAHAWIVNQPLTKADLIVVLGGGADTRPFEAARLFHQGLAPKILLMNPRPSPASELELLPTEAQFSRGIMLKKDVPADDILVPTEYVTNSFDEAILVRNWALTNRIKSVIIPTDVFHTRRVRWLFGKELKGAGIRVEVEAVPVHEYSADDWWQREQGIIAFQNEILKYWYYRLKY